MATDKQRIIELQKSVRIARTALEYVRTHSYERDLINRADDALDKMFKLEPKQPLQELVGHERRPRP